MLLCAAVRGFELCASARQRQSDLDEQVSASKQVNLRLLEVALFAIVIETTTCESHRDGTGSWHCESSVAGNGA